MNTKAGGRTRIAAPALEGPKYWFSPWSSRATLAPPWELIVGKTGPTTITSQLYELYSGVNIVFLFLEYQFES